MLTFKTATKIGEGRELVDGMPQKDVVAMVTALDLVNEQFGLDMRAEFYLSLMKDRMTREELQKTEAISGVLHFTEDSPYYGAGEKTRKLANVTEIHWNYETALGQPRTAFESDIEGSGFTIETRHIKELEVFAK